MPVNPKLFDKDTAKLLERYPNSIRRGSSYSRVYRCPTGSPTLDWATFGGFPIGRRTRIVGEPSGGKTHVAWHLMRSAQNLHIIADERYTRLAEIAKDSGNKEEYKNIIDERDVLLKRFPNGMEVVYYNVENNWDPTYVSTKGVDVDRVEVIETRVIETIGSICESLLRSRHLHIIDSTSAPTTLSKMEVETEKELPMVEARRWGDMFSRIGERFDGEENMLVYVSHTYLSGQGQYAKLEEKGGRRMKYDSDMTLNMRQGGWLYYNADGLLTDKESSNTISGLKEPDGLEFIGRITKSRVSPPFRTARVRFGFDQQDYDIGFELSEAAMYYGFGRKSGGWRYLESHNGTPSKAMHETEFRQTLISDVDLRDRVTRALVSGSHSVTNEEINTSPELDES